MSGSSTTLIEIGYEDFIKNGQSKWNNLHDTILSENDDEKRLELRRKSVAADYFISGANAIAQSGGTRPVWKNVSQVAAAARAHLLDAHHSIARVAQPPDVCRVVRLEEARPAGAGIEFGTRPEQR